MTHDDYSLTNLEEWIDDSLHSGARPQEIYDVIIDNVKKNIRYHKACYNDSIRFLALLRGNNNKNIEVHDSEELKINIDVEEYPDYAGMYETDSADNYSKMSHDEMIEKGYTMTDDGFWIPPQTD